jgi:hypothetical protein
MPESREALAVAAKQRIGELTAEHLHALMPLLYLSLPDLRELGELARGLAAVRDEGGHGHVTAILHDGRLVQLERTAKVRPPA